MNMLTNTHSLTKIQQPRTNCYRDHDYSFNDQGWFNATEAANRFGKRPIDWYRLEDTQEYISALCNELGISEPKSLIKTKRNSGTWYHPKLAVPFARWLDKRFGVWCDLQIDNILRGNHPMISKQQARHKVAATYKVLCDMVKFTNDQSGKESKPHHFMNEARLINWAMTGKFTGLDRDSLNKQELDLLAALEVQDILLLGVQLDYESRKKTLNLYAQQYVNQHLMVGGAV